MSFTDNLNTLIGVLQADPDLAAFVAANWPGKTLSVKRAFKSRSEINVSDLPIIMITAPRKSVTPDSNIAGTEVRSVNLYCGFNCENRELASDLIIVFEELVEKAMMRDPTLGSTIEYLYPGESANDEGKFHPVYFIAKEITIHREVTWI